MHAVRPGIATSEKKEKRANNSSVNYTQVKTSFIVYSGLAN